MREGFARRAAHYRLVAAEPAIAARTTFFVAAARICEAFACAPTRPFFAELSEQLELFNLDRARLIRQGVLYANSDIHRNTADFITAEQTLVEQRLTSLQQRAPAAFARDIQAANNALLQASHWYVAYHVRGLRNLNRAIHRTRHLLGRLPRFESQPDRELIGLTLTTAAF